MIRVAMAEHDVVELRQLSDWRSLAELRVQRAVDKGAQLLTFAEYGGFELVAQQCTERPIRVIDQANGLQPLIDNFVRFFSELAVRYAVWIVAPSLPLRIGNSAFVNRSWVLGPGGEQHWQDKIYPTPFEKNEMAIVPGKALHVFQARNFRFAVAICYDSEFPLLVRSIAVAGAHIVVVPTNTESWHGHHRVMWCARARAVENQCFVGTAPLVGSAPWCEAIDTNVGRAGIYAPPDGEFPEDGTLAFGADESGWAVADCDLDEMARVRRDGAVQNMADGFSSLPPVVLV